MANHKEVDDISDSEILNAMNKETDEVKKMYQRTHNIGGEEEMKTMD